MGGGGGEEGGREEEEEEEEEGGGEVEVARMARRRGLGPSASSPRMPPAGAEKCSNVKE